MSPAAMGQASTEPFKRPPADSRGTPLRGACSTHEGRSNTPSCRPLSPMARAQSTERAVDLDFALGSRR